MEECKLCKKEIPEKELGLTIRNYALKDYSESISICKPCVLNVATEIYSGNIFGIARLLKGLKK